MIQLFLNKLDHVSTSNMIKFMNVFSKKILSILDAILSLPMNCDIKSIILSFMFINSRKLIMFSTIINHESEIMCAYFGDMICEYRSKHTTKGLAVRKILNHVATLDLEVATRIMCICKQFTTLMFNNQHSTKMFMILMIDNNTNMVSLYPLCIGEMVLKRAISIFCVLIDYWIDCCDVINTIIYDDGNKLNNINSLIENIKCSIRSFGLSFQNDVYYYDSNLFY